MQEDKRLTSGDSCPGVHLKRSASRGMENLITQTRCQSGRAVTATAIDQDHLVAARAQRGKSLQRRADAARLVQRGDDYRESLSDQS